MNISKKSQMEIFGILIVVVLIFLGMYFMMTFGASKTSSVKDDYVSHQLSANVLNSILSTKVICTDEYNLSLTELLQNCASENDIYCDKVMIFGEEKDRMISACDFVNETIYYIFNNTLNQWKIKYLLNITKDEYPYTSSSMDWNTKRIEFVYPEKIIKNGHSVPGCMKKYGGKSKMFPVPLHPGTLWIELFVCN